MGGSSSKYKMNPISDKELETQESNASKEFAWIVGRSKTQCREDAYETIAPIGKGKYGMVFLAKQQNTNKHVAIKYIPKQFIYEHHCVKKIQQEINVLQTINHPFVIKCLGGFSTQACLALIFEYAYGGELFHRMKQVIKMEENEAKFYFCEIASVLHYLHDELNIVFRDLKPENILIDHEGHVKVCDFGFAVEHKNISGDPSSDLKDGCGTIMYMAPEIASGKTTHGFPVDWWSLGVVLMEMVTGEAPFGDSDNKSKFEIFTNIAEKTILYPLSMSSNLKKLLKGLLNRDPRQRFNWAQISTAPWLHNISFHYVTQKRYRPPWIPSTGPAGNTSNFVKWQITVPKSLESNSADLYCSEVRLPKARDEGPAPKDYMNAALGPATDDNRQFQMSRKKSSMSNMDGRPGTSPTPLARHLSRKNSIQDEKATVLDSPVQSPTATKPARKSSVGNLMKDPSSAALGTAQLERRHSKMGPPLTIKSPSKVVVNS